MTDTIRRLLLAAALASTPAAAFAQEASNAVRLPPSVAATPIEIPGTGRRAATPIEIPGAGRQSATPIEIPGRGRLSATPIEIPGRSADDLVASLPVPIPGERVGAFDPASEPERFAVQPLPLPRPQSIAAIDGYVYAVLPDGTVYGDTRHGYTRFASVDAYRQFLRRE